MYSLFAVNRLKLCGPVAAWVGIWIVLVGVAIARAQEEGAGEEGTVEAVANGEVEDTSGETGEGEAKPQATEGSSAKAELYEGRLVRVRLPLTGNADSQLIGVLQRAVATLKKSQRPGSGRPVLLLELTAQGGEGGYGEGTDFTRALAVADYLVSAETTGIKTVAYVPRTIKGHGVLIALACEVVAMAPDAELGEAGIDEDDSRPIKPNILRTYQQTVEHRKPVPTALAMGMLDSRAEVLKVETDQATEYVLGDGLEELEKTHTLVSPPETIKPSGTTGNFTGRQLSEYSDALLLATDRESLARGLSVAPSAVVEDQSLIGDWRPVFVNVEGPITPRMARQLDKTIAFETRDRGANWVGVRIDSTGGDLEDCKNLAHRLAGLAESDVETVAYIPAEASGGAAMIALACDQLVMHPEANLGGPEVVREDRATLDAALHAIQAEYADRGAHGWSLAAAMIDPEIELFTYQNTQTGGARIFSPEEAAEQKNASDWRKGPRVKAAGEPLRLSSQRAKELGIATHVVDSFDELKQLYGFERDPRVAKPNWALELIEALASPGLAAVLLVIGFVGIYVELHTPGVGAGAFVAALAFMLFFWSNFLHGTAGWLEVLLFVGGIVFLLIEMLVLPGFGIFGLGGALMILSSLVLASQTFVLPQSDSELRQLRQTLTMIAGVTAGVLVAGIVLRRYLPHTPFFRTILLDPPAEEDLIDLDHRESLADYTNLIGQQGVATTNLMPAGKGEFNGQLVDVIAEGLPIERGQAIVVTKARGSRVVVREVDA